MLLKATNAVPMHGVLLCNEITAVPYDSLVGTVSSSLICTLLSMCGVVVCLLAVLRHLAIQTSGSLFTSIPDRWPDWTQR